MDFTWVHTLDPVALSAFGWEVRWYGLAYALGFFIVLLGGRKLLDRSDLEIGHEEFEHLVFGGFLFGILGGRLGEFLFYAPHIFWTDPLEVFKIWHGGMSIHGGILGSAGWIAWWCRKNQISFLRIADILVVPLAFALALGRGANFVNAELVGVATDQTWGVMFPTYDYLLRHPTQLYELAKNLVLGGGLCFFFFRCQIWKRPGALLGIFLVGYGVMRFGIELWKVPDGMVGPLSTGQWLCGGMVLVGGWLLVRLERKVKRSP